MPKQDHKGDNPFKTGSINHFALFTNQEIINFAFFPSLEGIIKTLDNETPTRGAALLDLYRKSPPYQVISNKNPVERSFEETIIYAFVTDDLTKLSSAELESAILCYKQSNKKTEATVENLEIMLAALKLHENKIKTNSENYADYLGLLAIEGENLLENLKNKLIARGNSSFINFAGLIFSFPSQNSNSSEQIPEGCNFNHANVSGNAFENITFNNVKMRNLIAYGSTFKNVKFINCDLENACFVKTNWNACDLIHGKFERVNFLNANFENLGEITHVQFVSASTFPPDKHFDEQALKYELDHLYSMNLPFITPDVIADNLRELVLPHSIQIADNFLLSRLMLTALNHPMFNQQGAAAAKGVLDEVLITLVEEYKRINTMRF